MAAKKNWNIPDELYDRVAELAKRQGRTVTDVINSYLYEYVSSGNDKLEQRVSELEAEVQRLKEK